MKTEIFTISTMQSLEFELGLKIIEIAILLASSHVVVSSSNLIFTATVLKQTHKLMLLQNLKRLINSNNVMIKKKLNFWQKNLEN